MKTRSVNAPKIKGKMSKPSPGPEQQGHADHVDAGTRIHEVAHNRVGTGADGSLLTLVLNADYRRCE